ncbi:MAG: hypothetical protein EOO70_02960, partial [Myxococcaceae bacterium]
MSRSHQLPRPTSRRIRTRNMETAEARERSIGPSTQGPWVRRETGPTARRPAPSTLKDQPQALPGSLNGLSKASRAVRRAGVDAAQAIGGTHLPLPPSEQAAPERQFPLGGAPREEYRGHWTLPRRGPQDSMPANRPNLPLFHERSISDRLSKHVFSPAILAGHSIIQNWVEALRTGALDDANERNLQGEFLQRIFGDVLGYHGMSQAPTSGWELMAERTVGSRGLACDGALGFFSHGAPAHIVAPIELKGARQPLDLARGRERTPVEQGWNYANYTPGCRYIIVSNFRETRLYSTARTPEAYEVFFLEELSNLDAFKRFLFLLSRDTLLPPAPQGRSVVDELLTASAHAQKEITNSLYSEYRRLRINLFAELRREHPNRPAAELLASAQTLLDRILFIAFAEDRGLLPERTIEDAFKHRDRYSDGPVWRNFQTVFRWIDEGNLHQRFPPYNGGLFRADPKVDTLKVSDALCERFKNLATYSFRDEVSVEVLGHIFEQSIADLEELRAEAEAGGVASTLSKRKVEGVFYTPSTVTRFIVEETLGKVLKEREEAAFEGKSMRGKVNQVRAWEAYRDALKDLRILDPACGSGAFLIAAFDLLAREYERVNVALAELRGGQIELFDLTKTVLNNNLFGVDLNGESVEITKLSL